jgi:hypothetical protein
MFKAITVGLTRLSSSSSRPPRLDDATSGMGVERIDAASSMMTSRMTASVLARGSGSIRVSALVSGATVVPSPRAVPYVVSGTGYAGSVSTITVSIAMASGIAAPSVCAPAKICTRSQFQQLRLLRMMTISCNRTLTFD